jgi:DNA-binding protein YbaB
MFGKLAQMGQMMAKAKEIKAGMEKMKSELPTMEFSASSANGRVKVTVSGDLVVKSIEIAPTADVAMLGNEVTETVNSALNSAKLHSQSKMMEITGGIDLDGLL